MSLTKRLLTTLGKDSKATVFAESTFGEKNVLATTDIKMANLMLSGDLDGGITSGSTMIVGDSRTFKCAEGATPLRIFVTKEIFDTYFSSCLPD